MAASRLPSTSHYEGMQKFLLTALFTTGLGVSSSHAQPADRFKMERDRHQVLTTVDAEAVITKIRPHELAGSQAATLYVRNIPVLTFISSHLGTASNLPLAAFGDDQNIPPWHRQRKLNADNLQDDPVGRARVVAAKLDRLSQNNFDASQIVVQWNRQNDSYTITVNSEDLVTIDAQTRLPDTTKNPAQDALQATNRLRRLMGNASPLAEIPGKQELVARQTSNTLPAPTASDTIRLQSSQTSLRTAGLQMRGIASWYGPGFNGRRSASGEIFNQNALTAAHRKLPFGTQVRVTNLNNNRSAIVRINDRGPHIRGRIIDLSTGAARMLGITQTGVAPVILEVLAPPQTAAIARP